MSQKRTVRGPGRAIIAVTLLPQTALLLVGAFVAVEQGSLVAVLDSVNLNVGMFLFWVAAYFLGTFIVFTGRVPFARSTHEEV